MAKDKQSAPKSNAGPEKPPVPHGAGPSPSPMGPWGPDGVQDPRLPNLYQLQSDNLQITYSPSGYDGQVYLIYHHARQMREFRGGQVRTVTGEWGALVTVTLESAGNRSTDFTLAVPKVVLTGAMPAAAVKTFAFMTLQEIGTGQNQLYAAVDLSGTASRVEFSRN
jgi:hypothetical protein